MVNAAPGFFFVTSVPPQGDDKVVGKCPEWGIESSRSIPEGGFAPTELSQLRGDYGFPYGDSIESLRAHQYWRTQGERRTWVLFLSHPCPCRGMIRCW
jgi:hypothetical protein